MKHIAVCVCTYKRPDCLKRLLEELGSQETGGRFTYSISVADNDHLESGKAVVEEFARTSPVPVKYCIQSQQNIALARNKAIENAEGDFIAFIDDDEFPTRRWLLALLEACESNQVDGVLGPVKRHFDQKPPKWILEGNFYERPTYTTGSVITWSQGRTNNLLFKREVIPDGVQPFRPEFRTGEDQDFFRRFVEGKCTFIWCNDAVVYEEVPPVRWKRSFILRRALLQGAVSVLHPDFGFRDIAKSAIAVPVYIAVLPFAALGAHHRFMTLLVKLFDHVGKLLAVMKVNPIREPYVTQ